MTKAGSDEVGRATGSFVVVGGDKSRRGRAVGRGVFLWGRPSGLSFTRGMRRVYVEGVAFFLRRRRLPSVLSCDVRAYLLGSAPPKKMLRQRQPRRCLCLLWGLISADSAALFGSFFFYSRNGSFGRTEYRAVSRRLALLFKGTLQHFR